jgi:hypothetical protein
MLIANNRKNNVKCKYLTNRKKRNFNINTNNIEYSKALIILEKLILNNNKKKPNEFLNNLKKKIKNDIYNNSKNNNIKIIMCLVNLQLYSIKQKYKMDLFDHRFVKINYDNMKEILKKKDFINNYDILCEYCCLFSLIKKDIKNLKYDILDDMLKIIKNYDPKKHNTYIFDKILTSFRQYYNEEKLKNNISIILDKIIEVHKFLKVNDNIQKEIYILLIVILIDIIDKNILEISKLKEREDIKELINFMGKNDQLKMELKAPLEYYDFLIFEKNQPS